MFGALLLACFATPVVGDAPDAEPVDTSAEPDTADTGDAEDTAVTEAGTDWAAYVGERAFSASAWGWSCEESVEDAGVELTEGESYDAVMELCPVCTHVFENTPDAESACDGAIGLGTSRRGLLVTDQGLIAYFFEESDGEIYEFASDASGAWDTETAAFDYEGSVWGVPVAIAGFMTFEVSE